MRLHIVSRNLSAEKHAHWVARNFETNEPEFFDRVDDNNLATTTPQVHQRCHQSRMVTRRVSTDNENRIAFVQVIEHESSGACPESC